MCSRSSRTTSSAGVSSTVSCPLRANKKGVYTAYTRAWSDRPPQLVIKRLEGALEKPCAEADAVTAELRDALEAAESAKDGAFGEAQTLREGLAALRTEIELLPRNRAALEAERDGATYDLKAVADACAALAVQLAET